jgi:hypothetical protein
MKARAYDGQWNQDEFSNLSWHDAPLHGISFDWSSFSLILDIDYSLAWSEHAGGFQLVPALLRFENVSKICVSFVAPNEMLFINRISREGPFPLQAGAELREYWAWFIVLAQGQISFEATGFSQRAYGSIRVSKNTWLSTAERRNEERISESTPGPQAK